MNLDTIKRAVNLLDDPILIMQSKTVNDSIVLFGDVYTTSGKPVMVSLLLNPKTKSGEIMDYAVITSTYGRRTNNVQNLIDSSVIYYVHENKERTESWLQALGLHLPSAVTKLGSIASIPYTDVEVNGESVRKLSDRDSIRYSDRDPDAVKVNQLLQKQNAELRETVGYLKELVKLQGKVTDGTVYTRGSVEAAARKLIRCANANGDVVQLQRILEKTYRAMGEGPDSMMGLIDEAAQWLVDHKRPEAPKLDGYAQTILSDLRGRSIRLNDSQKAEASYLIGNFTDYRRRFFGTLNITDKAGTSLDQFWQEMSTLYPDVFQPDISSSDMPRALYDAVDSLKSMYEVQTFSPEEMAEAAINEQRMNVWESFTGLVPIKTVADRNKAQVETVKNRYRTNTGAV